MAKRSAWDGERKESWRVLSFYDPYYVDGFPTNEERLRHLDFYTRERDTAPIIAGGKGKINGYGTRKLKSDEVEWLEEHKLSDDVVVTDEGIPKVGV